MRTRYESARARGPACICRRPPGAGAGRARGRSDRALRRLARRLRRGEPGRRHAARNREAPAAAGGRGGRGLPGMIVTQHSGDGKANQLFLRGYNLDHGTDFATWVAGMPVNTPTHAHGQGYTDLNFVIPELISRVTYNKGPYFAEDEVEVGV